MKAWAGFRAWLSWLVALLFRPSLESLLASANAVGNVVLQTVALAEGPGWTCTIRPSSHASSREHWAVNSWGGQGETPREALVGALDEAAEERVAHFRNDTGKPKLGGREFDE